MGLADGVAWEKEHGTEELKVWGTGGKEELGIPPLQTNRSGLESPDIGESNMQKAFLDYKNGIISEGEFVSLTRSIRANQGLPETAQGPLKDSGARREFDTGAVRDISEGKGRCDLLPLATVGTVIEHDHARYILQYIEKFKEHKEVHYLSQAIWTFAEHQEDDIFTIMLEVSKHYEDGAKKYSENNWMRGLPLHSFIDSGVRHLLKHLRGDTDEPHDRAFVWNMLCAMWTISNKPELDDIMKDILKEEEK